MAAFLVIAGFTGAIIAFQDELDEWLNPHLFQAAWQAGQPMLDPYQLQARAQQKAPANTRVDELQFKLPQNAQAGHHGEAVLFRLTPMDPQVSLPADQLFIDPQSGKALGARLSTAGPFQRETLLPFLYKLHYSLALPGVSGRLIMGIVAVLWTLDTFVAFFLTLPRRQPQSKSSYWQRWKPAWLVKWQASGTRINFDLHRAVGLWLCSVLLIFAWSSVMFNLREQVYLPVMTKLMPFDLSWRNIPKLPQPLTSLPMSWPQAHQMAQQAMQGFAQSHHLQVDYEDRLRLDRERGVYQYFVHSSADLREDRGNTAIAIDAYTGEIKGHWLPTQDQTGNTFSNWIGALHMAQVFGLPYRVFVCVTGLLLVLVTVTGVLIWSRKRQSSKVIETLQRKKRHPLVS